MPPEKFPEATSFAGVTGHVGQRARVTEGVLHEADAVQQGTALILRVAGKVPDSYLHLPQRVERRLLERATSYERRQPSGECRM
jgi:hypothetical protein